MGQISNRFFVTSIKDGTLVTAVLYSDKTLEQRITPGTNASIPDWTDSNEQPTVRCVVRAGVTTKQPTSYTWSVNGSPLTFNSSTHKDTTYGIFEETSVSVDGVSCPAVKIKGNLVTAFGGNNADNDVLTCEGNIEYNGAQIGYTVNTTIRLSTMSGSGYYGYISGDSYVESQTATATMSARLKTADGAISSFKTKWYREGVDDGGGWPKTVVTTNGVATTTIAGSEITDFVVVRCDFYAADDTDFENKLYAAYWDVDDREDTEEMYMCSYVVSNVKGGLDVSLREGQSVQMLVWIGKRGDQTNIDARYQVGGSTYKCRLLDSEGATITSYTGSGVRAAGGSSDPTPDNLGFIDIKCNIVNNLPFTPPGTPTPTTVYGGSIIIPATFADAHGGKLTGIVVVTA